MRATLGSRLRSPFRSSATIELTVALHRDLIAYGEALGRQRRPFSVEARTFAVQI